MSNQPNPAPTEVALEAMTTLRQVLIVSPHFPPINAPDLHRVRMGLGHYERFGWRPIVLAVDPFDVHGGVLDPYLLESIPDHVEVHRVRALPYVWTRWLGIGSLALRSLYALNRAAREVRDKRRIDLVYFSTALFPVMILGRLWKRRHGWPYVLDIQDPWIGPLTGAREKSLKGRAMDVLHCRLEPLAMETADGILAVSPDYVSDLHERHSVLRNKPSRVVPFGGSKEDVRIAREARFENRFFRPGDGSIHGVYVGVVGDIMHRSLTILFRALNKGRVRAPSLFSRVRLHCIGTDYAPTERGRFTVEPIARRHGLERVVTETPTRVPYFEALRLLLDADFLFMPGSADPQYTASKLFPYILARKPLLAIFHEHSTVVDILRETEAGEVVTFGDGGESEDKQATARLTDAWEMLLRGLPFEPNTNWRAFHPYTALESTRNQCELFDEAVEQATMNSSSFV